jgi:flagellar biosynthesis chaperone FliJ
MPISTTANFAQQLHDAGQLKRLRELRERTALNALRNAEAALQTAKQEMKERQNTMLRLQNERQTLAQRIVGELATDMARLAAYVSALQARLDDQLERAEYALIDDEQAVADAQAKVDEARQAWLHAVSRHGAATTLVDDASLALRLDREVRAEREDIPRSMPVT